MNLIANQIKYGWIKAVTFTIDQRNHGCMIMVYKCIQQNIGLLLKDYYNPKKQTLEIYDFSTKNVYTDKLVDIVNKYNNAYHSTNKMETIDVKSSPCIDFNKRNNIEDPKFKVGDHDIISEYKNIFANGYVPNWS